MAYLYIQAEIECEWCAARAPGAELRISTARQELTCIPVDVESQVTIEKLPQGWDWTDRSNVVRCTSCAAKQNEEQAARARKKKR